MKLLKSAIPIVLAIVMIGSLSHTASAQNATSVDVERLQDALDDASRDVMELRGRDTVLASRLQTELDELRDDTTYLKVKIRKNEPVARTDYFDLRDRIDAVRSRARGTADRSGSTSSTSAPSINAGRDSGASRMDVPVGTELDVRLQSALSSATAAIEDRVDAATIVDLREGDRVIVPAGSVMRGLVTSVTKTTRLERKGSLTLEFDQISIDGITYPIRATVTEAIESEGVRGETGRIGAGAGVGAIIGGILGGFKGAIAGILIGGGGTIAATEGKDVELPPGTVLRVRIDSGLNLR